MSPFMMFRSAVAVGALALASAAGAQGLLPQPSRGQLLYSTHCVACHTTQMHWRDNHRAGDWPSLKGWVRHWQGSAGLNWSDADINEVARHLNDTIYRFQQTTDRPS